ncbi:hypothetical protein WJX73_001534 [Symbiochloris irregularis]|uniref:Signal recognition particle SRP54 subunit M-domain domain-containing protein n=1 Tax=Symbiochloris irregularis TaxID=706552 RepID=A0AAW1PDS8_9CHLO
MPSWLQSRLPNALGGTKEPEVPNITDLDSYAAFVKRTRQMGSLTGRASSDPVTDGMWRMQETIIGNMTPQERKDPLTLFGWNERLRVAQASGCAPAQVNDCIAKFEYLVRITQHAAALQKAGKPMPQTLDDMKAHLGDWRPSAPPGGTAAGPAAYSVAEGAVGPKGKPCGLAGMAVSRNTKCPLTRKAYKACCGRQQLRAIVRGRQTASG